MPTPLSTTAILTLPPPLDHSQGHAFVGLAGLIAGVLGIAHEVDEDLQHLVFVEIEEGDFFKIADDFDAMPGEGANVQAQAVLDQAGKVDDFPDPGYLGIALLHGDDILDVLNVDIQRG